MKASRPAPTMLSATWHGPDVVFIGTKRAAKCGRARSIRRSGAGLRINELAARSGSLLHVHDRSRSLNGRTPYVTTPLAAKRREFFVESVALSAMQVLIYVAVSLPPTPSARRARFRYELRNRLPLWPHAGISRRKCLQSPAAFGAEPTRAACRWWHRSTHGERFGILR